MWVATSDSTIRHWSLPSNLGSIANNSNDSLGQHHHKPVVKVSLCKQGYIFWPARKSPLL